jgi:hypothetical protein
MSSPVGSLPKRATSTESLWSTGSARQATRNCYKSSWSTVQVCSSPTTTAVHRSERVLKQDPHLLFLTDVMGATPLSYIRKEHYDPWIRCLEEILDVYWPRRRVSVQGRQGPPPLSLKKPRSVPLPNPVNALPVKLAVLVASGRLDPFEAMLASVDNSDEMTLATEEDLSLDGQRSHQP